MSISGGVPLRYMFTVRLWACLGLFASSFAGALSASSTPKHWISLTTPHFEMYTGNSEKDAIGELQFFEEIRSFFMKETALKASPDAAAQTDPVKIIAFRSESEYEPYSYRSGGGAYYLRILNQDYVVLQDLSPRNRPTIIHEFTHLTVEHAGLKIPIWLNEGLAELYSTIEPSGDQVALGRALPRHIATLARQSWIDWNVLFAVDHDSSYYNEAAKAPLFYAQSWALTHMLALGADYKPRFADFMATLSAGHSSVEALQKVYGKPITAVEADLKTYIRQKLLRDSLVDVPLAKSDIQPAVGEASEFAVDFALASLLSSKPAGLPKAKTELAALSKLYPERPETEELLGYLDLAQSQWAEAGAHLAVAIQRHSINPEIIYHYSELQRDAGATDKDIMALLRKVLASKPDYEDARLELGILEGKDFQCESAMPLLSTLKIVPPDQAYTIYSTMADCSLELKQPQAAEAYALKAKLAAKDDAEKQRADDLLDQVASARKPH